MQKERGEKKEIEINADAERIRPILEKDPDWPLASGKQESDTFKYEEWKRKKSALSRLTKKAVNLLYPDYVVSVKFDRGTASNWLDVNFKFPKTPEYLEIQKITQRTREMLICTGLQYPAYFPDSMPGKDDWTPCLNVSINHFS
jgi:hypothetical protein